jgi:hypothetical protein
MIDGSTVTHPHHLGMLMLRFTPSKCQFGQAKQCVINVFDTNYVLSTDDVIASILHLAHNIAESPVNRMFGMLMVPT